jgi:DNA polymerase III delta subunit
MRFQEAISSLKYKRESKYSLVGAEQYLKELFIKTAKSVYSDYTIMEFFPEDQDEALSLLTSNNFFGQQLFIFNDFNKIKPSLGDAISKFDGCLIIVLPEKIDTSSRAITTVTGQTAVVECNKLRDYGTDYPLWIRNQIQEAGYTASEGLENLIFSRVGPNMFVLANELEKLLIMKMDKIITPEDVNKIVSITAVSTAFDIFENLMKKDIAKALYCFDSYARSQENLIDITAFIGSYFEKMYRILLLREQKFEIDDIADIVGIPRFMVKLRYMPKALAFGKDGIASKIDAICHLDAQLRSFKGDKRLLFERFILEFSN